MKSSQSSYFLTLGLGLGPWWPGLNPTCWVYFYPEFYFVPSQVGPVGPSVTYILSHQEAVYQLCYRLFGTFCLMQLIPFCGWYSPQTGSYHYDLRDFIACMQLYPCTEEPPVLDVTILWEVLKASGKYNLFLFMNCPAGNYWRSFTGLWDFKPFGWTSNCYLFKYSVRVDGYPFLCARTVQKL